MLKTPSQVATQFFVSQLIEVEYLNQIVHTTFIKTGQIVFMRTRWNILAFKKD